MFLAAGTWLVRNITARFSDFRMTTGNIIFELTSSPTDLRGVHYVQVGTHFGNLIMRGSIQGCALITLDSIRILVSLLKPGKQLLITPVFISTCLS